jgi:hypothetical protein
MPVVRVLVSVRVVSWPKANMFAVTLDGKILMNAQALEGVNVAELVGKKNIFVGVVLRQSEARQLSEHLYDASSETAAFIVGKRRRRSRWP